MKKLNFIAVLLLILCSCNESRKKETSEKKKVIQKEEYYELSGYRYRMRIENGNEQTESLPIVLVLHSMGSGPDQYINRVNSLDVPARIIYLEAPYKYESGFTFFKVDPVNYYELEFIEKRKELLNETNKLANFIIQIVEKYQPSKKPVIIGASQGGDLSFMIALKHPRLISASLPLLSTLDEVTKQEINTTQTYPLIRVFHGQDDSVVSIQSTQNNVEDLKQKKLDIELITIPNCDHQITELMKEKYISQIRNIIK